MITLSDLLVNLNKLGFKKNPTPGGTAGGSLGGTYPNPTAKSDGVKYYGAKGDGVTDDSAAITAAMAASGTIYYSDGTYVDSVRGNLIAYGPTWLSTRASSEPNGFYGTIGATLETISNPVPQYSRVSTGTDFTWATTWLAFKFVATQKWIQGVQFRLKSTGTLASTSNLFCTLYNDNGSGTAPGTFLTNSGGGHIYAADVTSSFTTVGTVVQNVGTEVVPGTTYWLVVQKNVSGGDFVLDSQAGSGVMYSGNTLGAVTDTNSSGWITVQSRSAYGFHTYAPYSHGVWAVSYTGVGVRGDSHNHYGLYGNSVNDVGCCAVSSYTYGGKFTSLFATALYASSPSNTAHGFYCENTGATGHYSGISAYALSGPGGYFNSGVTGTDRIPSLQCTQGIRLANNVIWYGTSFGNYAHTSGDLIINSGLTARGGAAMLFCTGTGTPGTWAVVPAKGLSADQGDASPTVVYGAIASNIWFNTPLTTNRTLTLTAGAPNGAEITVTRAAGATGVSTLTVSDSSSGALRVLILSSWAKFMSDGTNWQLIAYGTL